MEGNTVHRKIPNVQQPSWLLLRKAGVVVFQKSKTSHDKTPPVFQGPSSVWAFNKDCVPLFVFEKPHLFASSVPSIAHARPWVDE
jgi:hypothetical protein